MAWGRQLGIQILDANFGSERRDAVLRWDKSYVGSS